MKPSSDDQLALFGSGPEQAWSYSRLKSLRRCALEYKVRWVDAQHSLFQPGHIGVQAGRLLHHIVREYFRTRSTARPHQLLLELYERLAPHSDQWKEELQGERRALNALRLFAESRVAGFQPVALEVGCKSRIGGVSFSGQADAVYEASQRPLTYGLLELKLNDVEVGAEEPAEKFLQSTIYFLGLPDQYRYSTRVASIYVFDTGQLVEATLEKSMIERAIRIVEAAVPLAKGPDFPPTLNPFCRSCGYQDLCPAYSKRGITR
jgi:CRISPR/Cas system-associated exonuclease Cas4 (RecB family)